MVGLFFVVPMFIIGRPTIKVGTTETKGRPHRAANHGAMEAICEHLKTAGHPKPTSQGCEECIALGDTWVHLRLCLTCGHVGCCDDSKNKHATKHYHSTHHPVIRSFQPGENWRWCFVDELIA
jgi:uncharacterized UBP type Zn finger protein